MLLQVLPHAVGQRQAQLLGVLWVEELVELDHLVEGVHVVAPVGRWRLVLAAEDAVLLLVGEFLLHLVRPQRLCALCIVHGKIIIIINFILHGRKSHPPLAQLLRPQTRDN